MSHLRFTNILATVVLFVVVPASFADGCLRCWHKCPSPYGHCQEGPPRLRFKCGCPKPVCDPGSLEHYGYYQTCWRPWPFPSDMSHCPEVLPPVVVEGVSAIPAK
jgi:hypothetical protein